MKEEQEAAMITVMDQTIHLATPQLEPISPAITAIQNPPKRRHMVTEYEQQEQQR
jgi:hypothetical protein